MDDNPPLPSTKNIKKGKKRRRSSKKSPSSDGDDKSITPPQNAGMSKSDGRHLGGGKPPIKSINAVKNNNSNGVKVRSGDYPYPTDYNDHFETPARAYDDIFPLLEYHILSKKNNRNNNKKNNSNKQQKGKQVSGDKTDKTIVYDPYYCTGRAAIHLDGVFQRHKSKKIMPSTIRIQHEKRDFYRDIQQKCVPKYDILITNPPYSGNHKERCLEFAINQLKNHGRPFFLLMPNYIAMKEYFRKIVLEDGIGSVSRKIQTFYIAPSANHSYEYEHPEGTGHKVSPFSSVWFCGLSSSGGTSDVKSVTGAFVKFHSSRSSSLTGMPRIATSLQELIRVGGVSGEKRKNPRQRKKMRQQAMQRANNAGVVCAGAGTVSSDKGGGAQKRKSIGRGDGHVRDEGKRQKKRRKSK